MKMNTIHFLIGSLSGLVAYFSGLNFELIILWIIFLCLDVLSGLLKSLRSRRFSSRQMRRGLTTKAAEVILLLSVIALEGLLAVKGFIVPLLEIFVGFLCIKEFSSIVENCNTMGVKIPECLMKWIRAIDDDIENRDNKDNEDVKNDKD